MAEAILASVSKYGYKEMVPFINARDTVSLEKFKTMKLAEYFVIDSSRTYVNGHANPNHIYEFFGNFGGHDATQVRLLLLKHIARDPGFHMRHGTVCLGMRSTSFQEWLHKVADDQMYCDELGVLSLSHMYRRHSLVVTINKMWSTIEHKSPLNLLELLNECSVKLVYMGQLRFGVLKPRPKAKPLPSLPAASSVNPSSSTAVTDSNTSPDESTGDAINVNVTIAHVPVQNQELPVATTVNVGTAINVTNVETNSVNIGCVATNEENGLVPVETSTNKGGTSHVGTSTKNCEQTVVTENNNIPLPTCSTTEDHLLKSTKTTQAVLPTKTVSIILKPLSDFEINYWSNNKPEQHCPEPVSNTLEIKPSSVYGLRARKQSAPLHDFSLRKTNHVNYAPMLDSDANDSDDTTKPITSKPRPKLDGPSPAVIQAHAQIQHS